MPDAVRLLSYPYVVVRVTCSRCSRSGSYRLARLAERYGAEIRLTELLELLSGDCKLRDTKGFVGSASYARLGECLGI